MLGKYSGTNLVGMNFDNKMHAEIEPVKFVSSMEGGVEAYLPCSSDAEMVYPVYIQVIPLKRNTVRFTVRHIEGGDMIASADYSTTEYAGLAARFRYCLGLGPEWGAAMIWMDVNGRHVIRFEIPPIDLHGVIAEIERAEEERLRLPEKAAFDDGGDYE